MDVRRSTSRWTISLRAAVVARLVPVAAAEAARAVVDEAVQAHLEVDEVQVPVQLLALVQAVLLPRLSQALRWLVINRRPLVVVDKPVAVDEAVPAAVAEVPAEVQEVVEGRLWRVIRFVRVLRFPAWRSSMLCLPQAPIRMSH
jgi:hypothetical protein